MIVLLFW